MNRVQLMMERFFNQINNRVALADVETKFKPTDIKTVIAVEQDAMTNFGAKPPSINSLARKAAMSTTKFKNLFKTIYGTAVYEHYQQRRMEYAARLLSEGNISVKEVSSKTGYSNLGNFSAAFKKQFRIPPHEFVHKNE
jgi:AraC-like DNA-binding protein